MDGFDSLLSHQYNGSGGVCRETRCHLGGRIIAGSSPVRSTNNPRVAQLVEHGIEDPGVGGSTPSPRTIILMIHYYVNRAVSNPSGCKLTRGRGSVSSK